ncbi:MAG TPA: LON peptidase substrate-binding domain-containing protein [Terriglobales bacterium]
MSSLLPLFPLDLVLFPGAALPLHIFEPRYREMISECLVQNEPFGVVRTKDGGLAEIGCTAAILEVTKKYDDGRMDISTEGRRRFEVMQVNQDRAFLQADVFYLEDEAARPTADQIKHALNLHGEIMKLAGSHAESAEEIDERQLSFHLTAPLPLDLDFKQNLLAMQSEAERLNAVILAFEALLPAIRRTMHLRSKAGGNGHG